MAEDNGIRDLTALVTRLAQLVSALGDQQQQASTRWDAMAERWDAMAARWDATRGAFRPYLGTWEQPVFRV